MNKNYHQLINCYEVIIKPTFHQLNMLMTSGFEGIIWVRADIFYILKDRNQIPMSECKLSDYSPLHKQCKNIQNQQEKMHLYTQFE